MAFSSGRSAAVYVGGYNLSAYTKKVDPKISADLADVTCLGATAKAFLKGLEDATITLEGFFDGAAGAIDAVLSAALYSSSESVVCLWPIGETAIGALGYGCTSKQKSYNLPDQVEGVVEVNGEIQSCSGLERMHSLHPLAAETDATGPETSHDDSAASTAGYSAFLQITAFNGTDITIIVEESANNSDWTTLGSFTQATAIGAQRIVETGNVARYVRVNWSGTFTSCTFSVGFARK